MNIRVTNRKELLDIKVGNREYCDLLAMADVLIDAIESAYITSPLPDLSNQEKAIATLIKIREQLYS